MQQPVKKKPQGSIKEIISESPTERINDDRLKTQKQAGKEGTGERHEVGVWDDTCHGVLVLLG